MESWCQFVVVFVSRLFCGVYYIGEPALFEAHGPTHQAGGTEVVKE